MSSSRDDFYDLFGGGEGCGVTSVAEGFGADFFDEVAG